MASLRYHAGRMVLYEEEPNKWRVKIKTKQGKLNLPLQAKEKYFAYNKLIDIYKYTDQQIKDLMKEMRM